MFDVKLTLYRQCIANIEKLFASILPQTTQRFPSTCANAVVKHFLYTQGIEITEWEIADIARPRTSQLGYLTLDEIRAVLSSFGFCTTVYTKPQNDYSDVLAEIIVINSIHLPWTPQLQRNIQTYLDFEVFHALLCTVHSTNEITIMDPSLFHGGQHYISQDDWRHLIKDTGCVMIRIITKT